MAEEKKQVTLEQMRDWLDKVEMPEVRDLPRFLGFVREALSGVCATPTQNDVDQLAKTVREYVTAAIVILSQFPGGLEEKSKEERDG